MTLSRDKKNNKASQCSQGVINYLHPGSSTVTSSNWLRAGETSFLRGVASLSPPVPSAETFRVQVRASGQSGVNTSTQGSLGPRGTSAFTLSNVLCMQRGTGDPDPERDAVFVPSGCCSTVSQTGGFSDVPHGSGGRKPGVTVPADSVRCRVRAQFLARKWHLLTVSSPGGRGMGALWVSQPGTKPIGGDPTLMTQSPAIHLTPKHHQYWGFSFQPHPDLGGTDM